MKKQLTFLIVLSLMATKLFAGASSVQVASGASASAIQTLISTEVGQGNTEVTLLFAKGGTWGSSAYGSDMTLAVPAGVTKLTLTYDPATTGATPLLYLNTLTYSDNSMTGGLTIDGLKVMTTTANRYLISSASNTNFPATATIQNSWIEGYRGGFVLANYTNTVSQVTLTNSVFRSIGVSGIISTGAANNTVSNISITNNTFIDCDAVASAYFIDHRTNNPESTTLNFSNNTVYFSKGQLGNGFVRLTSSPSTSGHYTFNNNLFASGVTGTTFRLGYGSYSNLTGSGNYVSSKLGTVAVGGVSSSVTFTAFTENLNLFNNTFNNDFTINDQNFIAKTSVGNTGLYASTLTAPTYNITSSIKTSVGDVNSAAGFVYPSSTTVSSGTSATLTARPSYGYTFKEWDDASGNLLSTNNPYTISSVSADKSVVAVFTPTLIVAWDFNPSSSIVQDRPGDYYYNTNNKGVMKLYETDNTTDIAWVNSSLVGMSATNVSIKTGARRSTTKADIQASKCRFFQAEFSTKGYKTIQVKSKIAYDNNSVFKAQKLQYSTDGTSYTDLTSISDISTSPSHIFYWLDLNGTLPVSCDNQAIIYLRWINAGTVQVGTSGSETVEDFYLADVEVTGTPYSINSASGDFIATTSGDVNTASNWIQWGGTSGTTGVAVSAPTSSINVWIPAGIAMTNSSVANVKDLNISGTYTASAALSVTGNLNIKSDANGTGTLLDNGNLTVTGNTNAQQYLPDARNWYVSSPVSTSSLPASGFTVYNYNETTNNWDTPVSFAKGMGYIAFPGSTGSTLTFSGTLNTADVDVTLTQSGTGDYQGYNLIGNPYPCHLTWTTAFVDDVTNAAKIEPTIWVRHNAGTVNSGGDASWSFQTWNAHAGEAVPANALNNGIIPPMQAFWVKAKVAGTLTLDSKLTRSHQSGNALRAPSAVNSNRQRLRMEVSNGSSTDEALIYFDSSASNGYDTYDSPKMSNSNTSLPEIYTSVSGEKLVINGLNSLTDNTELALGFRAGQSGTFSLKATQISNFEPGTQIILKDKLTGKEQLLSEGSTYSFSSDASTTTDRFSVVFKTASSTSGTASIAKDMVTVYRNEQNQIVVSTNSSSTTGTATVYSISGSKLSEEALSGTSTVLQHKLSSGVYLVKVNNGLISSTYRVIVK